jgi:rhamnosyl/mannosyltransferase
VAQIDLVERPLRVCHLGKFYPPAPGGIEKHVQALAEGQAALGAEVSVLCVNHADKRGRDVTHLPVAPTPTLRERVGGVDVMRMGRLASVARFDVCPRAVAEILRRRDVDVLHLQTPNPLFQLVLCAVPRLPLLVITHQSDVVRQRVLRVAFKPVERRLCARAALLFASSEAYIEGSPLLSEFRDKVKVLPLGINLSAFEKPSAQAQQAAAEFRERHGDPLWLMVGRLIYYKGFDTALEALRGVTGRLLIVGTGPLEPMLRRRVAQFGLSERVTLAGHLDEESLVGAYRAATALWFPSNARSEAFGLTQVEAMASGCPVINTAVVGSGVPWVSPDGVTGLTIPVADAPALARAAQRLIEDPALRARLGAAGVARARAEFDRSTMVRRSVTYYAEALRGTAARP